MYDTAVQVGILTLGKTKHTYSVK